MSTDINSTIHPEQAAILRDIARDGTNDEVPVYSFGDIGSVGQSNGLSNNYQDLEDTVALLEKIATFEHPEPSTAPPHDHFASLVQAASEVQAHGQNEEATDQPLTSDLFTRSSTGTKRKRSEESDYPSFFKHPKNSVVSEEDDFGREREIWGPAEDHDEEQSAGFDYEQRPDVTANARAIGVHSAAALFRRPTLASKKYTRPPMSKLFLSLELTPEQFIHLQAAAKAYMLDPNHPERVDCVGNRGRADTDMTKLKLFGCVKSFLEEEGWGDRCFGEKAQGAGQRKLKWPQMKNKLVSLVTPLLRRMVTNERQRVYANESRRVRNEAKSNHDPNTISTEGSEHPDDGAPKNKETSTSNRNRKSQRAPVSPPSFSDVDPKLQQYHYEVEERFPSDEHPANPESSNRFNSAFPIKPLDIDIKYVINIIKDGRRIKPRFTLTPKTCPGFPSLVQHIQSVMDDGRGTRSIQILGPNGLIDVTNQATWIEALKLIMDIEWMDGDVKCVVQMEGD